MLLEKAEFIRDPTDVCNTFNAYFCNNGSDIANKNDFGACFLRIHDKWKNLGVSFNFHTVSTSKVMKKSGNLECQKGCWI